MASPRSPTLVWGFALAISLALLVPSALAQTDPQCFELFEESEGVKLTGYKDTITVDFDVRESTPEGDLMYTLTWDADCVEPPDVKDTTFTEYFTVNYTTDCTWEISVNTSLIGLPDYDPQPVENNKISTQVTFTGFFLYEECTMTLTHKILDDNTQKPQPDPATYDLSIKEDFSPHYTISGFQTTVHDRDGSSQNNQFTVTTDDNCPLEATEVSYTSGEYSVPILYELNKKLNYEDFTGDPKIDCTVTFTDNGSPSLSADATVTITVGDVADEPPVFTEDFYYSEVPSAIYNDPLPVKPSGISAYDGDTGINAEITYKLTDTQDGVGGTDYFSINSKTGEVTLSKQLDENFLLNERVLFFVTASDTSQDATALLEVILPPLPTTTAPTESTTTCEPCTTPTYTTVEVTECPTCPTCPTDTTSEITCPVVTCPTTPGECTCEPCTTASTTDFTCPVVTCPDVTCPTTPGECTCEPCTTYSTTDFTCPVVTCPDITCPTTPGECTCEPCTTDSTTDFTCPVVTCPDITCPTTPGECTCEPCTTDSTTDFTCPDVTCPTTPGECTCEPCTADTTTDFTCPVVTCPTTPGMDTTITWGPEMPNLAFEQSSYAGTIFDQSEEVYQVKVNDVGYEVVYAWSEDSDSKEYFDINPTTGWITVNRNNIPDARLHELQAVATVKVAPSEQATTQVNILVLSGQMIIENSVTRPSMVESNNEEDVTTFTLSQPASNVCIIGAVPLDTKDHFSIARQDDKTWKVRKTGELDHEETPEITLAVQAYTGTVDCPEITDTIPSNLNRDQALAIISVTDTNDEKPVFGISELVVAYPTNEGLQRAVGPVVSVQAKDVDTEHVKYSLGGADAGKFTVDEDTAEVYAVQGMDCEENCSFTVIASDDVAQDQLSVKVLPLGMEHVFTLLMTDVSVSDVDSKLINLSQESGVQISKLYISPMQSTARRRRDVRDAQVSLEVHVYSIKNGALMSLEALNNALGEDPTSLQAEEFAEAEVFESSDPTDTTGLKVAVGVLGALLGIVLIAGIGFFVYKKRKPGTAPRQPQSPTPINTLGHAYQNHTYEKDGYGTQGSLGHKTNGSLNGFTSVEVHSSQDSPPMFRSPLARPSDTIPLTSIDQKEQQSGGLRRTNPSSPEYYGSSTPAPPPSFTRTTPSSSSRPEPSSSSSSANPIYAEVDKSKKTKSTTSSKTEKSVPLSDFPSSSVDKKPDVPDADYEEIGNTKFASLKSSPPPRRSNHHKADDDDDDDDVSGGVAYPGGKSAKFADEPAAQEEKKSVAFKVMVDTKEIEAQNMGPAQKRAEAEKLMEENRKKLQEEGNDDDEEETAKL